MSIFFYFIQKYFSFSIFTNHCIYIYIYTKRKTAINFQNINLSGYPFLCDSTTINGALLYLSYVIHGCKCIKKNYYS